MGNLRIAIPGATGRMGQTLIRLIAETSGCVLTGASEAAGHPALGQDVGRMAGLDECGVSVTDNINEAFANADVVIDFTLPIATRAHLEVTSANNIVHIIGTTGFTDEDENAIRAAAQKTVIIKSGNMSLGVNLLTHLTRQVAQTLGDAFDIEIVEMHHKHKVDAPSGTALMLGEAAATGRGVTLPDVADRGRDGQTGARNQGDIGFASLRGGNVVGDHTVMFVSDNERIELTHKAQDRGLFAAGALRAAQWAQGKTPDLYSMADVLGLND